MIICRLSTRNKTPASSGRRSLAPWSSYVYSKCWRVIQRAKLMTETFRVLPDAINEIHIKYSSCSFIEAKTCFYGSITHIGTQARDTMIHPGYTWFWLRDNLDHYTGPTVVSTSVDTGKSD